MPILTKHELCLLFQSDKFVLTKSSIYTGRGYKNDGMLKLIVMHAKPKKIMRMLLLLHARVFQFAAWLTIHINYNSLKKLINLKLIFACQIDPKHMYKICVEAKLTRSSFQKVKRNRLKGILNPLSRYIAMRDLKFVQTRKDNKYFITFVVDSMKYYCLY